MLEVKSTEDFRELLQGGEFDFRFEYGYPKPLHQIQLCDAHELVKAVWLHVVICVPHVELVQLQKGVRDTLQMQILVCRYPTQVHGMLVGSSDFELTSDYLQDTVIIIINYSPEWSNKRTSEEAVILNWNDYVSECTGNPISIGDIVLFMSGSSKLPAAGFNCQPVINFTNEPCLLKASTCNISITFPRL